MLSLAIFFAACNKEYVCPVPDTDRFSFDVLMPSYDVMTAKVKNAGCDSKGMCGYSGHGIIVYHYYDNDVFAFDATCPDSEECIKSGVVVSDGAGTSTGTCKRCGSRYNLMDGKHASKNIMLRPYLVQRIPNATDQYRISNY